MLGLITLSMVIKDKFTFKASIFVRLFRSIRIIPHWSRHTSFQLSSRNSDLDVDIHFIYKLETCNTVCFNFKIQKNKHHMKKVMTQFHATFKILPGTQTDSVVSSAYWMIFH